MALIKVSSLATTTHKEFSVSILKNNIRVSLKRPPLKAPHRLKIKSFKLNLDKSIRDYRDIFDLEFIQNPAKFSRLPSLGGEG